MVEDPELKFDGRTAMDLKDKFRTHFNDSYRQLYPNARTHIAAPSAPKPVAKVESNAHLFDKSRSRKRRPFTAEEDEALKEGYQNHGPSWATICCHPVFKLQNRRSTDLRDRFRNAFPELYTRAGYTPRVTPRPKPTKRRKGSDGDLPAPDKPRRGRRATTSILPDNQMSRSDGEIDDREVQIVDARPHTQPVTQEPQHEAIMTDSPGVPQQVTLENPQQQEAQLEAQPHPEMQTAPESQLLQSQPFHIPIETSQPHPASEGSTAGPADTSSPPPSTPVDSEDQISSQPSPIPSWPPQELAPATINMPTEYYPPTYRNLGMLPKSAWGPQDWLSSNPRMDAGPHQVTPSQSASSGPSFSFSPPHSLSHSQSQAVLDRYDLFPHGHMSSNFDFTQSEFGEYGGAHSAFSDADFFNNFTGFTHHSNTAGDLIFGNRSQGPHNQGNGYNRFQAPGGVNSMQLHAIDERVENIRLNDPGTSQSAGLPQTNNLGPPMDATMPLDDLSALQALNIPAQPQNNQPFAIETDHHLFHPEADTVATPTLSQPVTQPPTTSTSPVSNQAYPLSPRSMSLQSYNRHPFSSAFTPSAQDLLSQPANQEAWSLGDPFSFLNANQISNFGEDIPFLDMHYWGAPGQPLDMGNPLFSIDHTTGALDLAQSPTQRNHPRNFTRSPQISHIDHSTAQPNVQSRAQRPGLSHHRVQSAVAGFDSQPSYFNDNKRKRVSWDAGP